MKTEEFTANAGGTAKPIKNAEAPTTQRVASAAHEAIDSAAARADGVEKDMRKKAAYAGEKLEESQEKATRQVNESISKLEEFVKGRPVAAAGIAFAAGVLATALLRR